MPRTLEGIWLGSGKVDQISGTRKFALANDGRANLGSDQEHVVSAWTNFVDSSLRRFLPVSLITQAFLLSFLAASLGLNRTDLADRAFVQPLLPDYCRNPCDSRSRPSYGLERPATSEARDPCAVSRSASMCIRICFAFLHYARRNSSSLMIPSPSLITIKRFAATFLTTSLAPDGQRTSTLSAPFAGPSPKCSLKSFCE